MSEKIEFSVFDVTLRLYGKNITPENISKILGIDPTRSRPLGEHTCKITGKVIKSKTGNWMLKANVISNDVNVHISHLFEVTNIANKIYLLKDLVEVICIDIFIIKENESDPRTVELFMTKENISAISCIGARLDITI